MTHMYSYDRIKPELTKPVPIIVLFRKPPNERLRFRGQAIASAEVHQSLGHITRQKFIEPNGYLAGWS